jgi:hypothetical protein
MKHYTVKTYGRVNVLTRVFLTSALFGGERSASRPRHFTPGKNSREPLDRVLGGPQSRSGQHGEEKIFTLPGLEIRPTGNSARYTD